MTMKKVYLTQAQCGLLRQLIRAEANRLGMKPDTEAPLNPWDKSTWTPRIRAMHTILEKLMRP